MLPRYLLLTTLLRIHCHSRRHRLQQQSSKRHVPVIQVNPAAGRRQQREHLGPYTVNGVDLAGSRRRRGNRGGPDGGGDGDWGDSAGPGGCDDGCLGVAKEPLDGLPIGAVAELSGELEDTGRC